MFRDYPVKDSMKYTYNDKILSNLFIELNIGLAVQKVAEFPSEKVLLSR